MKYCTQVIKYSITNGLSFINSVEQESFRPKVPWAQGVETDTFGSGRLLRHHLEEVRLDPSDGKRLNLEECREKYADVPEDDLLKRYWQNMKEVRQLDDEEFKKHPRFREWVTLKELERFREFASEREALDYWEKTMRPTAGVEPRKRDPANIWGLDHPLDDKGSWVRIQFTEEELKKFYKSTKIDNRGDTHRFFERSKLVKNLFRHMMELMGPRDLPKMVEQGEIDATRCREKSERRRDQGFSINDLRRLAHSA